jgi:hypothetical protein
MVPISAKSGHLPLLHNMQPVSEGHPFPSPVDMPYFFLLRVKRLKLDAGDLPPSIAKVKTAWSYTAIFQNY